MDFNEGAVINRIVEIRKNQGVSKREVARRMNINEGSYGRIESGEIALSYNHLAQFASVMNMSVLDVLTYPEVFRSEKKEEGEESPEAILQIRLRKDTKDQVLKLVFGENNIEILNKL